MTFTSDVDFQVELGSCGGGVLTAISKTQVKSNFMSDQYIIEQRYFMNYMKIYYYEFTQCSVV